MHEVIHLAVRAFLILGTAVLFTLLVTKRPGAPAHYTVKRVVALFVVGAVIGVVFWTAQSMYALPKTLA
ncbi:hypothetical protein [Alicyclobacillus sp. ALC3]|uniref:hypothetical protein n=1 Tax=Alicyclobacillus sp. ALC3 TaxID=2796143 RepID=UPI002379A559|nr:hypothetical protein [Alicyclobacillus sp. ALC3]WDL95444.1 hypothetical protein JC200_13620 [Alicyclobacillus sp. ALC3]